MPHGPSRMILGLLFDSPAHKHFVSKYLISLVLSVP